MKRRIIPIIMCIIMLTGCRLNDTSLMNDEDIENVHIEEQNNTSDESENVKRISEEKTVETDEVLSNLKESTWIPLDTDGWIMDVFDEKLVLAFDDMDDHITYLFNIIEIDESEKSILVNVYEKDKTKMHDEISGFGVIETVDYNVKIILLDDSLKYIYKYGTDEEYISEWSMSPKVEREY